MASIVDFHSHLIPRVDDGAQSVEQSLAALREMAAQGITTAITTPHFDASLTREPGALDARLREFDAGWALLSEALARETKLPRLLRGTEVMLDEPDVDLSDPRIRLDGGRFVLCEFPMLRLPPNAEWGIANLVARGWQPIVAHPERYRNLDAGLEMLARLRQAGAQFQLNASSLTGQHGEGPEANAWRLLALGWIEYLSSDYHARGTPATAGALALLREHGAQEQARMMSEENPARLLVGQAPLPVTPFKPAPNDEPWWQRLLRRRGGG